MKKALVDSVATCFLLPAGALAEDTVRICILVAPEGVFAAGGADGVRNVEMAFDQAGGMAGGKKTEIVGAPSDTMPDTAVRQFRALSQGMTNSWLRNYACRPGKAQVSRPFSRPKAVT